MRNIITLILLVLFGTSIGQTSYVTNGSSTNWTTPTAWTPNGTPDINQWPNDNVTINHNMTYSGNLTARSSSGWRKIVTINSGATLTVTGSLTVNTGEVDINSGGTLDVGTAINVQYEGDITSDGDIDAASMVVSSSGSVVSNAGSTIGLTGNLSTTGTQSSTFNGDMTIGGNIATSGGPVNTVFGGDVTVAGDMTGTGNNTLTVNGTMDITGELNMQNNCIMNGTGIVGWTTVYVYGPGASYIECTDNTKYDSHVSVTYDDIPGNPFNLTTCNYSPLPVELLSFNVDCEYDEVEITWVTGAEVNTDNWEVQRSVDGKNWVVIGELLAQGYSSSVVNYSFIDKSPIQGFNYYRLKQNDLDGQYMITEIKSIKVNSGGTIRVYPNPPNSSSINIELPSITPVSVIIYDMNTRIVVKEDFDPKNNLVKVKLPENTPNGIYTVIVDYGANKFTDKLTINRR
jgi:hypothetical protein